MNKLVLYSRISHHLKTTIGDVLHDQNHFRQFPMLVSHDQSAQDVHSVTTADCQYRPARAVTEDPSFFAI